jgi:hypothetical protein
VWSVYSAATSPPLLRIDRSVLSQVLSESPEISVKMLCNTTYRFICEWNSEESTYRINVADPKSAYLTLHLKDGATDPTPENISGTLRIWNQTGTFGSLTPGKNTTNAWTLSEFEWEAGAAEELGDDFADIAFTEVKDGDGNPFLHLYIDAHRQYVEFLGKKQKNAEGRVGLTEGERERLGMNLEGGGSDDGSGEEEEAEEEEEGEEDADGSDEEEGDGDEQAPAGISGGKRKAEEEHNDSKRKSAKTKH